MSDISKVTVVMYHYVRDLHNSRYPEIRGLDINDFKAQLDYLDKYYNFVTIEGIINNIEQQEPLPQKAILLTFNDSYSDHFNNVFPILDKRSIQGCFYPEVAAIQEQRVLLNHKIHFVLAAASNSREIKERIFGILDKLRNDHQLESNKYYYKKLAKDSKYDSKDTIFVKRLLQIELPEHIREKVANQLFEEFIGVGQSVFSKELYLDRKQIKCMSNHGMHFGILGYHHRRYNTLSREKQKEEITKSRDFLINIGEDLSMLTASYPWGAYNHDTLDIMREIDCKVAFTTHADVADLTSYSNLELPRLDTNEIPKSTEAKPNQWYDEA